MTVTTGAALFVMFSLVYFYMFSLLTPMGSQMCRFLFNVSYISKHTTFRWGDVPGAGILTGQL